MPKKTILDTLKYTGLFACASLLAYLILMLRGLVYLIKVDPKETTDKMFRLAGFDYLHITTNPNGFELQTQSGAIGLSLVLAAAVMGTWLLIKFLAKRSKIQE